MQFLRNLFYKTYSTTLTVTSTSGFHLRPIAEFASKAKSFECNIKASFQEKRVNAKAVNTLLSLNLDKTDTFTLTTKGPYAKEALDTLFDLFQILMTKEKEIRVIDKKSHSYEGKYLEGNTIYEGTAIAPLYLYQQKERYLQNNITFHQAVMFSLQELENLYTENKLNENASIYLAQKELLSALTHTRIRRRYRNRMQNGLPNSYHISTLEAFEALIDKEVNALKGKKFETKIADYLDLLKRVKSHMGYQYEVVFPNNPFILITDDLLPSDILLLEKSKVAGVILKKTSPFSHTAILLRSAGITSIILSSLVAKYENRVILDAQSAVLVTMPSKKDYKKAQEQQKTDTYQELKSNANRFKPAYTKTKKQIKVLSNVSNLDSAHLAKKEGAEGIGLLRTEFLFDKIQPTFEDQRDAYTDIFSLFNDITVRTLDVGGDKKLSYIKLPKENNPFLGIRGVRLFKTHPQLIEEQLYAIFIAAKNKKIKIMFPMISNVKEFKDAKKFAQNIANKHQIDISHIRFGIMIEVPSVLFLLPSFNEIVDFYSIGTNDLHQYLFAIERTHPTLQIDALSPVIFTVINTIIKNATKPISICGELAANKDAIEKLITLGIETLSVSPRSIPKTKEEIRNV